MWEWFLPKGERQNYVSQIMEGPHGGSGEPMTWAASIALWTAIIVLVVLFGIVIWAVK